MLTSDKMLLSLHTCCYQETSGIIVTINSLSVDLLFCP